jgi:hypothetical protein
MAAAAALDEPDLRALVCDFVRAHEFASPSVDELTKCLTGSPWAKRFAGREAPAFFGRAPGVSPERIDAAVRALWQQKLLRESGATRVLSMGAQGHPRRADAFSAASAAAAAGGAPGGGAPAHGGVRVDLTGGGGAAAAGGGGGFGVAAAASHAATPAAAAAASPREAGDGVAAAAAMSTEQEIVYNMVVSGGRSVFFTGRCVRGGARRGPWAPPASHGAAVARPHTPHRDRSPPPTPPPSFYPSPPAAPARASRSCCAASSRGCGSSTPARRARSS